MFTPASFFNIYGTGRSSGMDIAMLAPWVIAMRMPALAYEIATPWLSANSRRSGEGALALTEKTDAFVEGFHATQAELISAWGSLAAATMRGELLTVHAASKSFQKISDAGIEPMAKRVRANYKRLHKPKK